VAPPRADAATPPGDAAPPGDSQFSSLDALLSAAAADAAVATGEEARGPRASRHHHHHAADEPDEHEWMPGERLAADPPSLSPPPPQSPSARESEEDKTTKHVKQWSTTPVVVAPAAALSVPAGAVVARPHTPAPLRVPGGERFQVAPPWAPPPAAYAGKNKVIVMPSCGLGNRMRNVVGAVVFAKTVGMPIMLSWNEIIPHVKERVPFRKIFGDAHPDFKIETGAYTYSPPANAGLRYLQRKVGADEAMCYGCSKSPPCVPCSWRPDTPRPAAKDLVFFGCTHCLQDGQAVDSARAHGQRRMCADVMARFQPPPPVEAALRSMNLSDIHDVGVHIRGGDKRKFTKKGLKGCDETTAFVNAMRRLPPAPDGVQRRFFVASDHPDWVEKIGKQFPKGVVVSAQHHEAAKMKDVHPLAFDIWGLAKVSTVATAAAAEWIQRRRRDNNEEISIDR
jgi:hypothetical protein